MSHNIEIVGMIDLDNDGQDPSKLYQLLHKLRRDCFQPHQKILVNYTEQDYFYYNSQVGFVLHNFLSVLYHVDISLSQIVFFTTHTNLPESIKVFLSDPNDTPEIHVLLVSKMTYSNVRSILSGPEPAPKDLKFQALCMLGTQREHRLLLYKYLAANNLLDRVQVSIKNLSTSALSHVFHLTSSLHHVPTLESVSLVYSFPPRTVEHWSKPVVHPDIKSLLQVPALQQFVNPNIPANGYDFYQHYAVDIVTETNFHYPSKFVSEKTLRPLLLKTPFLMFGPANFLKYLHSKGFKTFGDVWDESYDQVENPQDRFVLCCQLLNTISNWSLDEWNNIYAHLSERLDNNRCVLLQYIENDFEPLAKKFNYPIE
jgi:hypothetical protein